MTPTANSERFTAAAKATKERQAQGLALIRNRSRQQHNQRPAARFPSDRSCFERPVYLIAYLGVIDSQDYAIAWWYAV